VLFDLSCCYCSWQLVCLCGTGRCIIMSSNSEVICRYCNRSFSANRYYQCHFKYPSNIRCKNLFYGLSNNEVTPNLPQKRGIEDTRNLGNNSQNNSGVVNDSISQDSLHEDNSLAEDSISGWDQMVERRRSLSLVERTHPSTGPCSRKTERKTVVYNEHCVLRYTCEVKEREMCISRSQNLTII